MEGFIIFIIIAAISTMMSKNKESKKHSEQMPPFNNKVEPSKVSSEKPKKEIHSFEDFAKEFLGEIKETMEQQKPELKPIFSKPKEISEERVRVSNVVQNTPSETPAKRYDKQNESEMMAKHLQDRSSEPSIKVIPTSKQVLVQAFVMSEVLGPPKAKQLRQKRHTQ